MATDKTSEYQITAEPSGYEEGMRRVIAASKEAQKNIESAFSSIGGSIKSVTSMIGSLTAIMAGGAAFEKVVSATNAWNGEAKKLSVQMGVTTQEASAMMVAMRHLGIDTDTMTMAAQKLSKQAINNGDAFAKLGVKVKDANGQYRPMTELMADVNSKLKEIKNPIEQNNVGMQVYGKSWNEVRGVMKLTTEEIEKARVKARDLGLVVGPEGVEQSKQYKESMNDMKLVLTSLEVQIGSIVLPQLVKLGSWFTSAAPAAGAIFRSVFETITRVMQTCAQLVGSLWTAVSDGFTKIGELLSSVFGTQTPGAMEIFVNALKLVEIAFVGLKVGGQLAIEYIVGLFDVFIAKAARFAAAAERAVHLDWSGTKAAWQRETANVEAIEKKHLQNMVSIASQGASEINDILLRGPDKKKADSPDAPKGKGGPTYDFNSDKQNRMAAWEARLAVDKDGFEKVQQLAGTAQDFGKARERDYWKKLLDTTAMSAEERLQVTRRYLALEHDLRQDAFDSQIAGEKAAMEEFKNNHEKRIAIATQIYDQLKARYGEDSKEAKAGLVDIAKEQRKLAEQTLAVNQVIEEAKRNAALAAVDAEQGEAELQLATRQITAEQLLAMERQFEDRRFAIKMQALQAELDLQEQSPDRNPVAIAQVHAQIEDAQRRHVDVMAQINGKAVMEAQAPWLEMTGNIRSSFEDGVAGMISGANTLQSSVDQVCRTMLTTFSQFVAKKVTMWALGESTQTAATVAGNTTRTASDWWAAAQSVAANMWSAIKNIAIKAWEAAAAVYASIAAIPVVGPVLAPAMAVVATGAVMGFAGHIASARGGYDIPAGVNPVTQLHEKEMVLPAEQADAVRNMANGGGGGDYHLHVHAVDAQSVKRLFLDNGTAIVEVLKKQGRNFAHG